MEITPDERELLRLLSQETEPVVVSSLFGAINPVVDGLPGDDPANEEAVLRQLQLYEASVGLHQKQLVRIVSPANGQRGDLVEVTETGRAVVNGE